MKSITSIRPSFQLMSRNFTQKAVTRNSHANRAPKTRVPSPSTKRTPPTNSCTAMSAATTEASGIPYRSSAVATPPRPSANFA